MPKSPPPLSNAAAAMGRAKMDKLRREGKLREYQQAAANARWAKSPPTKKTTSRKRKKT